jgi:hypothetical protein
MIGRNESFGDFEPDGDVDGVDLAIQAHGLTGVSLVDFAAHFGRDHFPY